jgi:NitT/TauT family transport system permease protein
VGEIFAGHNTDRYGLGYLITMTTGKVETAYAFAAVLSSTVLSIAVFAVVTSVGSTILARWHTGEPQRTSTNA